MALPKVDLVSWFNKASRLPKGRSVLDRALWQVVPFNASVKPRVIKLSEDEVVTEVALRRAVANHLGSMHAAVLVTVGEYAQGLLILANAGKLGAEIIIQRLSIEYTAKAKGTVQARCTLPPNFREHVAEALARGENPSVTLESVLTDKKTGQQVAVFTGLWRARRPKG
ncbi:MAG: YiiD C-terminal domain-containing protein [Myxococcota bacterium]